MRPGFNPQFGHNYEAATTSCLNDDKLDELSEMYYAHYICVCEPPSLVVIDLLLMVS